MEDWHTSNNTDSVCEYAETALEHYMIENAKLKTQVSELQAEITRLKWMAEEHD